MIRTTEKKNNKKKLPRAEDPSLSHEKKKKTRAAAAAANSCPRGKKDTPQPSHTQYYTWFKRHLRNLSGFLSAWEMT